MNLVWKAIKSWFRQFNYYCIFCLTSYATMKSIHLFLAGIFFMLALFSFKLAVAVDPAPLAIGTKAPDFKLPATDGNVYTLASFSKAKLLVIIFTCNHCPTAQAYEDRMIELTKDYSGKGVAVVAISPNDPNAVR